MKFRLNLILVLSLIFILGAFCVSSCKKSTEEPVVENGRPILELINDKIARETQFADPTANYSDEVRNGLITKIETDLDMLNNAYQNGDEKGWKDIVEILREVRKAGETGPTTAPGQIISYFQRLRHGDPNTGEPPVENFMFKFAGAIVLPVNIENPDIADDETNFISLNTYIFIFDRGSGPESTDPAGSGDGDRQHRKICEWY